VTIFNDLTGRRIPNGRVHKQLRWEMWNDSALPSWLTLVSGDTLGFSTITAGGANGRGFVSVPAVATVNSVAQLTTAFPLDSAQFKRIDWTLEGLTFTASSSGLYDIEFSVTGTNCGITVRQLNNETQAKWFMLNAGGNSALTDLQYLMRGTARRNLTLTILPKEKWACLRQDDQVLGVMTATQWTDGMVTPSMLLRTKVTTGHAFRFAAVQLELEHN
jgi:hypothetical protein